MEQISPPNRYSIDINRPRAALRIEKNEGCWKNSLYKIGEISVAKFFNRDLFFFGIPALQKYSIMCKSYTNFALCGDNQIYSNMK
jgi:hypothetical protein